MRKNYLLIIFTSIIFVLVTASMDGFHNPLSGVPSADMGVLPAAYNNLFATSGVCQQCHYSSNGKLQDAAGRDISPVTDWQSTMMANSLKDPYFRAKVKLEGLKYPQYKSEIETVCTRCHAPLGNINAHHMGLSHFTLDSAKADVISMDGISCTLCHTIIPDHFGYGFSGNMAVDTNHHIYGPYNNIITMPMINQTGYTPLFGAHVHESALCGSCHTLITHPVDSLGVLSSHSFFEQTIYQEWKNSIHCTSGVSCQDCHMPVISDPVVISSMPPWLSTTHSPFGKHHLAGANLFMTRLLKDNINSLGLTTTAVHFDSTQSRISRKLQGETLELELDLAKREYDTVYLSLKIINKSGHKFPSGFPSRRAFVWFQINDTLQNEVFTTGEWDPEYELIGVDNGYEPHHSYISDTGQVQVYELVSGDIYGNVTTTLEAAYHKLKDNRIPPAGFHNQHLSYDTVAIFGNAVNDPDFNQDSGVQGSGSDVVHFRIPINNYKGQLSAIARIYYQTLPPMWMEAFNGYNDPDIQQFQGMYQNTDKQPALISEAAITIPGDSLFCGTISYSNQTGSPLSGVRLIRYEISGAVIDSVETQSDGTFCFDMLTEDTCQIKYKVFQSWGGVNSADALSVMKHFVGLETLTGLYLRAADVDMSGYINSVDALEIQKRFVGITQSFASDDWLFDIYYLLPPYQNGMIIKAVTAGDVNGSYDP